MDKIENGKIPASKEIKKAMPYIRYKLDDPDVIIKNKMIEKGVKLTEKYFEIELLDWELFIFALIHCYYQSKYMVVFDECIIMLG